MKRIPYWCISKIKAMQIRIFEFEDVGGGNPAPCRKSIERALDDAGILDPAEREEALSLIDCFADDCASRLRARGWEVVVAHPPKWAAGKRKEGRKAK